MLINQLSSDCPESASLVPCSVILQYTRELLCGEIHYPHRIHAIYRASSTSEPTIMAWPMPHLRHASIRVFRNAGRSLTMSSVEGPLNPPLSTSTLSDYFLHEILAKQSNRPALICRNEMPRAHGGPLSRNLGVTTHLAWDFDEFNRHINAVARGLLTMGVKKGDRVGVMMGNNRYCL